MQRAALRSPCPAIPCRACASPSPCRCRVQNRSILRRRAVRICCGLVQGSGQANNACSISHSFSAYRMPHAASPDVRDVGGIRVGKRPTYHPVFATFLPPWSHTLFSFPSSLVLSPEPSPAPPAASAPQPLTRLSTSVTIVRSSQRLKALSKSREQLLSGSSNLTALRLRIPAWAYW